MTFDMHFHIAGRLVAEDHHRQPPPLGCVVSRSVTENPNCLRFAASTNNECALFADPQDEHWDKLLELVDSGTALAYQHIERLGKQSLHRFDPLLTVSERIGSPVVLHISRHDKSRFDASEASFCLRRIVERFPDLSVVISHIGGENFREALRWGNAHPNIYLDTSRATETAQRAGFSNASEVLRSASEAIGADRLVYGSDLTWPYGYDRDAVSAMSVIEDSFNAMDVRNILRHNARKLLESSRASA